MFGVVYKYVAMRYLIYLRNSCTVICDRKYMLYSFRSSVVGHVDRKGKEEVDEEPGLLISLTGNSV